MLNYDSLFLTTRSQDTPLLLIDLRVIRQNVEAIRRAFPNTDVWYALKCNPNLQIATTLADLGVGFEIASATELRSVLELGIPAGRIMCLHTIKSPAFIQLLHQSGVSVLAVDCREEVEKVARFAPECRIVVRIEMDGQGSRIPLSGKFGCAPDNVTELTRFARQCGLRPAGVTLHVGSQCESLNAWTRALQLCCTVCTRLVEDGVPAEIISLGGGLPVQYTDSVPALAEIGELVQAAAPHRYGANDCRVSIEPGRAIAATAGTLVVSVVGTATRAGVRWVYLDVGTHHGLFEWLPTAGGLAMPITVEHHNRPLQRCRIAGPTCDSYDALPGEFNLPELQTGDRLAFRYAGAYTTSTATHFNGFAPPSLVVAGSAGEMLDG